MPILMDQILAEYADQLTKPHASGVIASTRPVTGFLPRMLAQLEAVGDAMRYLDSDGQIAWKATPRLRNYLMDHQLDAETDLEEV